MPECVVQPFCYSAAVIFHRKTVIKILNPDSRLACVQGVYILDDSENSKTLTFIITEGFRFLSLVRINNEFKEIILGYTGFHDFASYPKNKFGEIKTDSFNVCDLRQDGDYHVTILEKHVDLNGQVQDMFIEKEYSCDAGTIETFNRSLTIYEKVDFLPYNAYQYLKEKSKKNERNLVNEFKLDDKLTKAVIKTARAYLHNERNKVTIRKDFVVQGDEIIMDKIEREWAKVVYEGKKSVTTGWLKRSNLEIVNK